MNATLSIVDYFLGHGDRALVLSQRLIECLTHAPEIEEEVAMANIALDLLGQTRTLYSRAAVLTGSDCTEDDFAYWREDRAFRSPLLVEQPNGDFAQVMVRQLLHDAWALELWSALRASSDGALAGLAAKAVPETTYHLRHSSSWVVRLGDGTDESHTRVQRALDDLWWFTGELFECLATDAAAVASGVGVDPVSLRAPWEARMAAILGEARLAVPAVSYWATGGRRGLHSEGFGRLIAEMQSVARAHPGASW